MWTAFNIVNKSCWIRLHVSQTTCFVSVFIQCIAELPVLKLNAVFCTFFNNKNFFHFFIHSRGEIWNSRGKCAYTRSSIFECRSRSTCGGLWRIVFRFRFEKNFNASDRFHISCVHFCTLTDFSGASLTSSEWKNSDNSVEHKLLTHPIHFKQKPDPLSGGKIYHPCTCFEGSCEWIVSPNGWHARLLLE